MAQLHAHSGEAKEAIIRALKADNTSSNPASTHNINAIFNETYAYNMDTGFALTASHEEFWASVKRHKR